MTQVDQVDVAIIGGGLAGMTVAVAVARAGLRTLMLERSSDDRYICNSRLTGGVFHCALRAADLPAETLETTIKRNYGPTVNSDLAHAVARDVLPAIRWLQSLGVRFMRASADPWHRFVLAPPALGRTGDAWRNRGGDTLLRTLESRLHEAGGRVSRGREAKRILTHDGEPCGVAGEDFTVAAGVVVIADGGFQQDPELVAQDISPQPARLVQRNAGTGWGDGARMAAAIGAALLADQSGFYGHVLSRDAFHDERLRFYPWLDEMARFGMVVTPDGRRFCDESSGGIKIANRIAALTDPASATVVWDHTIWTGPARARFLAPNPTLDKLGATIHRAATIREVAALAGINGAALEREVAAYNAAIGEGTTDRLDPPRSARAVQPMPILTPPFYAAPAAAGMTYTMGGIEVDGCSRVRRAAGGSFDTLFAVGGSGGGVEGGPRASYVGGLVKAAATGWRAAQAIIARSPPACDPAEMAASHQSFEPRSTS